MPLLIMRVLVLALCNVFSLRKLPSYDNQIVTSCSTISSELVVFRLNFTLFDKICQPSKAFFCFSFIMIQASISV